MAAALLSFAALLCSCITQDKSLGYDFIPKDQVMKVHSDTIEIPLQCRMADSIQAVSSTFMALGELKSEEYGKSEFSASLEFCPSTAGLSFGQEPKIVSIHVEIPITDMTQTATNLSSNKIVLKKDQESVSQTIDVYRMKVSIDSNLVYNNSLRPGDYSTEKLNIFGPVTYMGEDTLRIQLDPALGQEYLEASRLELDSLVHFLSNHKGLYFKCSYSSADKDKGGRINLFNQTDAAIYLKYTYIPTWAPGLGRRDSSIVMYAGNYYSVNSSSFESKKLENDNEQIESIPVQSFGGILPFIDRNKLKKYIDNWIRSKGIESRRVIISRARVSIPFNMPEDEDELKYTCPQSLFPMHRAYTSDSRKYRYYYPTDDYESSNNPMGDLNRQQKAYIFDMTSTVQAFVRKSAQEIKDDMEYDIWLGPYLQVTDASTGTKTTSMNSFSQAQCNVNGLKASRKPTMEIVYSTTEE